VRLEFQAEVFQWRGPAPYYFVAVPEPMCDDLRVAARDVSYGWGVVPVTVQIGATSWTTSLFPKDGGYLVPLKDRVRKAEDIGQDDVVELVLTI
jgi:Domain of unknown function (DUF1905)